MRPILLKRPDQRISLLNADKGYVHPAFSYTRTGTVFIPQVDGTFLQTPLDTPVRGYEPTIGWHYRVDTGWTQSILRTNAFTNAVWTRTGIPAATQDAVGPNGATDSWAIVETTATSAHSIAQSVSFTLNQTYTLVAVVANRSGSRFVTLSISGAAFTTAPVATFNLTDSTSTRNATTLASGAVKVSNGYSIIWMTATATSTASASPQLSLHRTFTNTVDSYTGDGTSGVNLWAMNLTNTAYLVPLVSSAGATVAIGSPSWTAPLSSIVQSLPGDYSLGGEFMLYPVVGTVPTRVIFQLDAGAAGERCLLRGNPSAGALRGLVVTGGSNVYSGAFTIADGAKVRMSMRASSVNPRATANGTMDSTDSTITMPTAPTTVRIGVDTAGNYANAAISRLWLVKNRIGDGLLNSWGK